MPRSGRVARWALSLALSASLLVGASACTRGGSTAPPKPVGTAPTTSTSFPSTTASPPATPSAPITFAVIGDYGAGDRHERAVAKLVAGWKPDFVITTGDDYYAKAGGTGTGKYDRSTGAFYCPWLKDISTTGSLCPKGKAPKNAFFPTLGNHDYSDARPSPQTYLAYFRLPGSGFANSSGNERYYDFVEGPVHFFALNSNGDEPDGTRASSRQAAWLRSRLARSTSPWNVVYDHHPPFSSDNMHGPTRYMQWPFAAWGADAVLSGHAHTYERVMRDGIVYFVNGLGGQGRYDFGTSRAQGSAARFRANWGAQRVTVTGASMEFAFYDVAGALIDRYRLTK